LCFALDLEEQKRSGFHYQYSNYQLPTAPEISLAQKELTSMEEGNGAAHCARVQQILRPAFD
jgi:hypothetical protein